MAVQGQAAASSLGCEIVGVTLADAVDAALFDKVYEAFPDFELILFRNVELPPATQVAFTRRFGEVQIHVMNQYHGAEHPEIDRLSNVDAEGRPNGKHPVRAHWVSRTACIVCSTSSSTMGWPGYRPSRAERGTAFQSRVGGDGTLPMGR